MKKVRMAQVAHVIDIGPHIRRIVLHGSDLEDFPADHEGAHFKAIFPRPGQKKPQLSLSLGFKKWMRSYTVRAFDQQTKQLTVDFAVNDHDGLATNWAKNSQVGDYLGVAGPGEVKYPNYSADWHLLIADLTALPAVAAILEKLPENAVGMAFIQVPSVEDKHNIASPRGIKMHWIINNDLRRNALLEQFDNILWQDGAPAIFAAGETRQMKAIHQRLKTYPGYQKDHVYLSGYWTA